MSHRISVIIVNWNGMHHLQECLSALLNQTFKSFETVLVDNGSTDGSSDFVQKKFPDIKLIRLDKNEGFCKGNNIGIQNSAGEFVALLNNDTKADKKWLQELHEAINQDPQSGICASSMINYFSRDTLDTAGDGYDFCGTGFKIGEGLPVSGFQKKRFVFGACAGAALYRCSMLDEIGIFDEDFFAIGEDVDLSFRAYLAGYKCVYVPKAIVFHKVNQTVGLDSNFLLYHKRRNVEYTYFKNMPILLLFITFPFHIIYEFFTLIEAVIIGKLGQFLKSKLDFLRNLPKVLKKRRIIQQSRVVRLSDLWGVLSKNYLLNIILRSGLKQK